MLSTKIPTCLSFLETFRETYVFKNIIKYTFMSVCSNKNILFKLLLKNVTDTNKYNYEKEVISFNGLKMVILMMF